MAQFSRRKLTGPPPCLGILPCSMFARAFAVGPPVDLVRVTRSHWPQHSGERSGQETLEESSVPIVVSQVAQVFGAGWVQ